MAGFLKNLFDKKPKVHKVDLSRRFELLARVGQGSMSRVWRARDSMTGKMFAIKVLDKAKTDRFEARFLGLKKPSEGEIAVSLQHPNIVRTVEFGTTIDGEPYLVMDFVEGVSLSYLVDVQNDQMKNCRLNYAIGLGAAISYLHRQNWIHRDLCPRNVMIDQDNVVKLIDFGLVVPNTPDFQKPGNRTGTASYMAPELIKRQKTDQRIDVFSYAVTCYEMYTKRLPWDVTAQETLETVLQHINKPATPIEQLAPVIHPQVAKVIMQGLLSNPDDRWQTIDEMLVPFRKAHEEIEAQKALKRRMEAARSKTSVAANIPKAAKPKEDDDFFAQVILGEGSTKAKIPNSKAQISNPKAQKSEVKGQRSEVQNQSNIAKTKPTAPANPAKKVAKPATSADATSSKLSKSTRPPQPTLNQNAEIAVEDEMDGIEIEVEGDKLDAIEVEKFRDEFEGIEVEDDGANEDSSDEFDGIEIDDGDEVASSEHDDDEPVLRLPDDDDDVIAGIEIDEEAPATKPSKKPSAGK